MMKKKKLYFFNDYVKDLPQWVIVAISTFSAFLVVESLERMPVEFAWVPYLMIGFYVFLILFMIFQSTRKNSFHWIRQEQFQIKINGKKLDVDTTFLTDYYVKDDVLHIVRINRLDTFPVAHLREKDIKKMLDLMKIQQEGSKKL